MSVNDLSGARSAVLVTQEEALRITIGELRAERDRYRNAAELLRFELTNVAPWIYGGTEDEENVRRVLAVTSWVDVPAIIVEPTP